MACYLETKGVQCMVWTLFTWVPTSNTTVHVSEPFPTTLCLPISTKDTPSIGGTEWFFVSNPQYPSKIYLVTARHIVFCPDMDNNQLYKNSNAIIVRQLKRWLEVSEQVMRVEDAEAEQVEVWPQLKKAKTVIGDLIIFLLDVSRDWKEKKNCVLGHIVLSPPISLDVGEKGYISK
ncbi:hypothetical protein BKA83DRAFT_4131073 [Pisolithus microcarpus]|nr:hypothetical protein BKA83DRAFT_4131073 [Pisolithus microcarpus]